MVVKGLMGSPLQRRLAARCVSTVFVFTNGDGASRTPLKRRGRRFYIAAIGGPKVRQCYSPG